VTRLRAILVVATLALTAGAVRAPAAEKLTVCLETDTPPYSYHEGAKSGGFDLAVAKAVAQHLGRELKIQWYEISKTPDNDEPDPARAVNAMLHHGKCELAGGFVFIANDLTPPEDRSRLPDFPRETPDERKTWVKISNLISSKPYHYYPFTVLLGPTAADHKIASLDDLQGLRIVSEDGTLADAMLMWYGHRKYFRQIQHVTPAKTIDHGGGLLEHLDRGDFDVTFVALRRYDAYRAEHPATKIVASGYYYRIGFNIGFVAKPEEAALMAKVDAALDAMAAKKEFAPLAKAEGMTYVAPRQPKIANPVSMGDLMNDK